MRPRLALLPLFRARPRRTLIPPVLCTELPRTDVLDPYAPAFDASHGYCCCCAAVAAVAVVTAVQCRYLCDCVCLPQKPRAAILLLYLQYNSRNQESGIPLLEPRSPPTSFPIFFFPIRQTPDCPDRHSSTTPCCTGDIRSNEISPFSQLFVISAIVKLKYCRLYNIATWGAWDSPVLGKVSRPALNVPNA